MPSVQHYNNITSGTSTKGLTDHRQKKWITTYARKKNVTRKMNVNGKESKNDTYTKEEEMLLENII